MCKPRHIYCSQRGEAGGLGVEMFETREEWNLEMKDILVSLLCMAWLKFSL